MIVQLDILNISHQTIPTDFGKFLPGVFECMKQEMEMIGNAFYSHNPAGSNDTIFGVDRLFRSIESTWVGIFNNALKRADPGISTLLEFAVKPDDAPAIRCDLLFEWKDRHFIVEAKLDEYRKNWSLFENSQRFKEIIAQANCYYIAEEKYYNKDLYLVALFFEWIREGNLPLVKERVQEFRENVKTGANPDAKIPDFSALFCGDQLGLIVFGKMVAAPVL